MERSRRVILHLDMDAFFASVEQRDQPHLQGKPVIVGGSRRRGVVSAASYEARKFGVHSAMPMFRAVRLCPHAVFLPGRMRRYVEISRGIISLIRQYTPLVQPASIDEAFLDLSGTRRLWGDPQEVARDMSRRIREKFHLTCSIGLAPNKFLAKLASDWDKPDGLTVVPPSRVRSFLQQVPVHKLPGAGDKTLDWLRGLGIKTIADLERFSPDFWENRLGQRGAELIRLARGRDDSPVEPRSIRKSVGAENTFSRDIRDKKELESHVFAQSEEVGTALRKKSTAATRVTLKLKFDDFRVITRSESLDNPTDSTRTIFEAARSLLMSTSMPRPVRLSGVSASGLSASGRRISLFPEREETVKRRQQLDRAVDSIRERFGTDALQWGPVHLLESEESEQEPGEE